MRIKRIKSSLLLGLWVSLFSGMLVVSAQGETTVRETAIPSDLSSAEFAISTLSATSEEAPAIDNGRVVWFDDRTHGPTDVWGYDMQNGQSFQVTSHPKAQFIADISGDIVVYEDNRDGTWDIYATNLSTGSVFAIATGPHHQRYPRIWGDYVVYQDETADYFQSDVYLYQISTGQTTALAVTTSYQGRPDIDNGWIVWTDWRTGTWQLGSYNINTRNYAFRPIDCDDACRPRVSGHEVVWNGWRNGNYDIYLYDLVADVEHTVYEGPGDQRYPSLSETLIAWQDEDTNGNWDIYLYGRASGKIFPISLEPSMQIQPAVEGNTIIWQDNRSHTWDIYGFIWDGLTPPVQTPALKNPKDLHVAAYPGGEIHLFWTDNTPDETGYVVQRAEGIFGTGWQDYATLPANTTFFVDPTVIPGQSYWYRIRAFNNSGNSSYSNESYSTAFEAVPNPDEQYMLVLINEARMDPGSWGYPGLSAVDPLGWQPNLAYSTRAHALGMNNSDCCQGHIDLASRGPSERAFDAGYPYGTGENLTVSTRGHLGMESAHQRFMDSTAHRNNILAADLHQAAVGFPAEIWGALVEDFSGGPAGTVAPTLPSGIAIPYTDPDETSIDFLVNFWNAQKVAPSRSEVVINGISYPMSLRSGVPGRGTYIYSANLANSDYRYHFEFEWGSPARK